MNKTNIVCLLATVIAIDSFSLHMTTTRHKHVPRKIVIVGGGIGGLSSAYDARHLLPHDEVTVVSERPSFEFTPSNPWVALGTRLPEDIRVNLAETLPKHGVSFVNQGMTRLDPVYQHVYLKNGEKLDYDYLIAATGPHLAFEEIPGSGPAKHSVSICSTSHAVQALAALEKLVEHPGPVVVGAMQGASCFGPAYEYAMSLHHELERRGGKDLVEKCPITFITSEPYVGHLGLKGAGDSKAIITKLLQDRGIEYITNCSVDKIRGDAVEVTYHGQDGGKVKQHKRLPSKLTMVIPPFRGLDIWKRVPGLTNDEGLILADEHQQSTSYPNIFAVGVCADIPGVEKTMVPTGAPKTGFMIESMGTAAIKNIKSMIRQEEENTTRHARDEKRQPELHHKALMNGVCIVDFGDDGAVFLSLPQMPPRRMDMTIQGKLIIAAKVAFEKYFLHKIRSGDTDPVYEKYMLQLVGIERTEFE